MEWVLPTALIGLVILAFCSDFPAAFRTFLGNTMSSQTLSSDDVSLHVRSMGKYPYLQTVNLTLSDGSQLSVDYPSNLQRMLEVDGANGTTDELLAVLHNLASELLAKGEITQAQYNHFEALANQGHRLSEYEKAIEAHAALYRNNLEGFYNEKVIMDGKEYQSVLAISYDISWIDPKRATSEYQQGNYYAQSVPLIHKLTELDFKTTTTDEIKVIGVSDIAPGRELRTFYEEYLSLRTSGALNHPGINTLVKDLTEKISILSSLTENQVSSMDMMKKSNLNINGGIASAASHYLSGSICNVGGGNDSGIQCPKMN